MASFAQTGIGADKTFDASKLSPELRAAIEQDVGDAWKDRVTLQEMNRCEGSELWRRDRHASRIQSPLGYRMRLFKPRYHLDNVKNIQAATGSPCKYRRCGETDHAALRSPQGETIHVASMRFRHTLAFGPIPLVATPMGYYSRCVGNGFTRRRWDPVKTFLEGNYDHRPK